MASDRILDNNNIYNGGSNKVVYLDTFASRQVSQSEMFGSKINQNSTDNPQPDNPNTTPNMSIFSKSLTTLDDLQQLLDNRKRCLKDELVRMRKINRQLQQEVTMWKRREVEFRGLCQRKGVFRQEQEMAQDSKVELFMAMGEAHRFLEECKSIRG